MDLLTHAVTPYFSFIIIMVLLYFLVYVDDVIVIDNDNMTLTCFFANVGISPLCQGLWRSSLFSWY